MSAGTSFKDFPRLSQLLVARCPKKRKEAAAMEKSTMSTMCSLAVRMMLVIGDDDGAAEVVHNGLHRISAHHESTITSTH